MSDGHIGVDELDGEIEDQAAMGALDRVSRGRRDERVPYRH
jgi:hypothetical protein